MFRKPNIHVESDWGFLGFIEKIADKTEHWNPDPRYTSQCSAPVPVFNLKRPFKYKADRHKGRNVVWLYAFQFVSHFY